jgi:hypothetical protein
MRKILVAAFAMCFISGFFVFAGDLQITCAAGYSVFIDGNKAGETTDFLNGLVVSGLSEGKHHVTISKQGFNKLEYDVPISNSKTYNLMVSTDSSSKVTSLDSSDSAKITRQTGTLIIRSLPLYADVSINGKKIGSADFRVDDQVAGPFRIEFVYKGKVLKYDGILQADDVMTIKADYTKNAVETSSVIEKYRNSAQLQIVLMADWQSCQMGGPPSIQMKRGKDTSVSTDEFSPGLIKVDISSSATDFVPFWETIRKAGVGEWWQNYLRRFDNQSKLATKVVTLTSDAHYYLAATAWAAKRFVASDGFDQTDLYNDSQKYALDLVPGKLNIVTVKLANGTLTMDKQLQKLQL